MIMLSLGCQSLAQRLSEDSPRRPANLMPAPEPDTGDPSALPATE